MKRINPFLRTPSATGREIRLDQAIYDRIISDMRNQSALQTPGPRWELTSIFKNDQDKQKRPSFEDMITPWIGGGSKSISTHIFSKYHEFLRNIDHLGLFDHYFPRGELIEHTDLVEADLGSMIDVNLIHSHLENDVAPPVCILEVGGGYGRLAEAFMNVFEGQVKYVSVDAVPASIYFSYRYLRQHLPNSRVGFYYSNDEFDVSTYDCFVLPSWHFEKICNIEFDVCINVASMQEMENNQIEYYLDLFNRTVKTDGLIYLSNSRDFIYSREYSYPRNWLLKYKRNTPRSRTPYHPVEILKKLSRDCVEDNLKIETEYFRRLIPLYQGERETLKSLQKEKRRIKTRLGEKRRQIERLKEKLSAVEQQKRESNQTLVVLRDEIKRLHENLSEKQSRIDRLKEEKNLLKANNDSKNQTIQQLSDETSRLNANLSEKQSRIDRLKKEKTRLRANSDSKNQTIQQLRDKTRRLNENLAEKQSRIDRLKEEKARLKANSDSKIKESGN